MKKKWKILLAVSGVIVIVLLFIYVNNKTREPGAIVSPTPFPTQSAIPSPTSESIFGQNAIYPGSGKQPLAFPSRAVGVKFSLPIDEDSVSVTIKPTIKHKVWVDPQTGLIVYITPLEPWKIGSVYNISVSAKSKGGQSLPKPVTFTFEPTEFTTSNMPSEY